MWTIKKEPAVVVADQRPQCQKRLFTDEETKIKPESESLKEDEGVDARQRKFVAAFLSHGDLSRDSTSPGASILKGLLERRGFDFTESSKAWYITWNVFWYSLCVQESLLSSVRPERGSVTNLPAGMDENSPLLPICFMLDSIQRRGNVIGPLNAEEKSVSEIVVGPRPWTFSCGRNKFKEASDSPFSLFDQLLAKCPTAINLSDEIWSSPCHFLELCHKLVGIRFFGWPIACSEFPTSFISFSVPSSVSNDPNFQFMLRVLRFGSTQSSYTCVSVLMFRETFKIKCDNTILCPETHPLGKNSYVWIRVAPKSDCCFHVATWPAKETTNHNKENQAPFSIKSQPVVQLQRLAMFLHRAKLNAKGTVPMNVVSRFNDKVLVSIKCRANTVYRLISHDVFQKQMRLPPVLHMIVTHEQDVVFAALAISHLCFLPICIVTNDRQQLVQSEEFLDLPPSICFMTPKEASSTTTVFSIIFEFSSTKLTRTRHDPVVYIIVSQASSSSQCEWLRPKFRNFCCHDNSLVKDLHFEDEIMQNMGFSLDVSASLEDFFPVGSKRIILVISDHAFIRADCEVLASARNLVLVRRGKQQFNYNRITSLRIFEVCEAEYYLLFPPFVNLVHGTSPEQKDAFSRLVAKMDQSVQVKKQKKSRCLPLAEVAIPAVAVAQVAIPSAAEVAEVAIPSVAVAEATVAAVAAAVASPTDKSATIVQCDPSTTFSTEHHFVLVPFQETKNPDDSQLCPDILPISTRSQKKIKRSDSFGGRTSILSVLWDSNAGYLSSGKSTPDHDSPHSIDFKMALDSSPCKSNFDHGELVGTMSLTPIKPGFGIATGIFLCFLVIIFCVLGCHLPDVFPGPSPVKGLPFFLFCFGSFVFRFAMGRCHGSAFVKNLNIKKKDSRAHKLEEEKKTKQNGCS